MRKLWKKVFVCLAAICCCVSIAQAASYTRRVFMMQQYNNVGGGTKTTKLNYVTVDSLSMSGVSAVTLTPVNSSGTFCGSSVTVYNGYNGHLTHSIGKGSFVDITFRNHYYNLSSSGSITIDVYWN